MQVKTVRQTNSTTLELSSKDIAKCDPYYDHLSAHPIAGCEFTWYEFTQDYDKGEDENGKALYGAVRVMYASREEVIKVTPTVSSNRPKKQPSAKSKRSSKMAYDINSIDLGSFPIGEINELYGMVAVADGKNIMDAIKEKTDIQRTY